MMLTLMRWLRRKQQAAPLRISLRSSIGISVPYLSAQAPAVQCAAPEESVLAVALVDITWSTIWGIRLVTTNGHPSQVTMHGVLTS